MTIRPTALCAGLLLSACTSQAPTIEFGVCLGDIKELTELKSLVVQTAVKNQLKVHDNSQLIKNDWNASGSEIEPSDLFALHVEGRRWFSETGQIIINNIGKSSQTAVSVSIFKNDALLGNDNNAAAFRADFVSAASARWNIIEAFSSDGTYHECSP